MEPTAENHIPIDLKDNSKRATWLITIFWCIILTNIVAALSGYMELELLEKIENDSNYTIREIELNDIRQMVVALLQTALYVATIFLFLNWFRRAYGNLHRLKMRSLQYDEVWSVWGFVVPIISLFYPYRIARELNDHMHSILQKSREDYTLQHHSWIVEAWWVMYLITNYAGTYGMRTAFKGDTLAELILSGKAFMVSDFGDAISAFLALYLVMKISEKEKVLYETFTAKKNDLFLSS